MGDGAGLGASGSGSLKSFTAEHAESAEKREERTTGSKRGRNDQRKIRQNPSKIPHFKVFPRLEADAN